jgi:hypothetical protein
MDLRRTEQVRGRAGAGGGGGGARSASAPKRGQQVSTNGQLLMVDAMANQLGASPRLLAFVGTNAANSPTITQVNPNLAPWLHMFAKVQGDTVPPGSSIQGIAYNGTNFTLTLQNNIANAHAGGTFHLDRTFGVNFQLHLFQSIVRESVNPAPGDFLECTFDGYFAGFPFDGTQPFLRAGVGAEIDFADTLSWALSTPPAVGNMVAGYWLDVQDIDGSTKLVLWESFNYPRRMKLAGDSIALVIPLVFPSGGVATVTVT